MIHCAPTFQRSVASASRTRGFTIIELVVVVLVMGILAAVATPRYRDALDASRVDAAAKRFAADVRHHRARAMMNSDAALARILIDPSSQRYTLMGVADLDHASENNDEVRPGELYSVTLASATFTNSNGDTVSGKLNYDLHGLPWTGTSTVAPLVSGSVVFTSGSQSKTVVINPVTGLPEIQ